jgi:hypothetical protein
MKARATCVTSATKLGSGTTLCCLRGLVVVHLGEEDACPVKYMMYLNFEGWVSAEEADITENTRTSHITQFIFVCAILAEV